MAPRKTEARLRAEATARSHMADLGILHRGAVTKEDVEALQAKVEWVSWICLEARNRRDWDYSQGESVIVMEHADPDFKAYRDFCARPLSLPELTASNREYAEQNPDWQYKLHRTETDLDVAGGHAVVYLYMESTGLQVESKMLILGSMYWRQDDYGKWWIYKFIGMRLAELGF